MSYFTNIIKSIDWSSFLNNNNNSNNNDSQVLDPISSLIRLVLLIYKPQGTKLSFNNNKIIFQEPDLFQSTRRWTFGDNRTHIHNLYNPIFKINLWYDITKPELIYILQQSQIGLKTLLECYNNNDSNIISHSINYYLETISNMLANNSIEPSDIMENTTDIYSIKLKNLWNDNEINIIYLLLIELEEKYNTCDKFNNSISLIDSIEHILNGKDDILHNIVNKLSTSL
jgi:hypothetical protein